MSDRYQTTLSEAGQLRRRQMLSELQLEMRKLHQRRRRRNHVAIAIGISAIIPAALILQKSGYVELPNPAVRSLTKLVPRDSVTPSSNDPVEQVIQRFGPEAVVRSKDYSTFKFEVVSDQEMLELLEAAGQPSALARIDGKLTVVSTRKPTS